MERNTLLKSALALLLATAFLLAPPFGTDVAAARDKQPPTAPTDLSATAVTATAISLAWTPSTDNVGVATYNVYKDGVLAGSSATPSYAATGLLPSTTYAFHVVARDATGNRSPASATLSVTTSDPPPPTPSNHIVVAYYTSWSAYNDYTPDRIPVGKVTHVNYAFANIGSDLRIALGDATIDLRNFAALNALKKFNPALRTLISVGGWSWSGKFSDVALTDASRTAFADSCVDFIVQYGFDGVDLDWEYPVAGGMATNVTRPEDKQNFTALLAKLRTKLDARGALDGRAYLLTIAGGAGPSYAENTELGLLSASLDFVNVMTYDIHGNWDAYTDFNAPLFRDTAASPQLSWSVDDAVRLYVANGVPKEKIVVGVPFYGKRYGSVRGTNSAFPGLYLPFGRCTTVTYKDIVSGYLSNSAYKRYFHAASKVPWLYNGSTFVSYEDAASIAAKMQYVMDNGLGGAMVWELSQDSGGTLIGAIRAGLD